MSYGKLIDGNLHRAGAKIKTDDALIFNPTIEQLEAAGYLPITETPYPTDGKRYNATYKQQANSIVLVWVEDTTPIEPSVEERLDEDEAAIMELAEILGGE